MEEHGIMAVPVSQQGARLPCGLKRTGCAFCGPQPFEGHASSRRPGPLIPRLHPSATPPFHVTTLVANVSVINFAVKKRKEPRSEVGEVPAIDDGCSYGARPRPSPQQRPPLLPKKPRSRKHCLAFCITRKECQPHCTAFAFSIPLIRAKSVVTH